MLLPSGRLSITVLSLSEEPLLKQLIEQVPRTCLLEHLHDSSSCPEKQRCSPWGNPALWSQQRGLRSSKGHLYCRERNHPWTTLYYCSVYWLAKIFAEIAVARVGFIAQSHALGPWGNGKADIPGKTPWVCCKLSRGGREGITPEQQYLNCSAGQCLVWVCKTQHLYTRTTHPRRLACCRDGKQIFTVESKKAALGMPHFEVTFIPQTAGRAARGKSSLLLLGQGGWSCTLTHCLMLYPQTQPSPQHQAWLNQLQKFNTPRTEKNKPPPNPVFKPFTDPPLPVGSTSHPASAHEAFPAAASLLSLPGKQPSSPSAI